MSSAQSSPQAAEPMTERRAQRRIAAECNALMRLSDSLTFRCTLRNLSLTAGQVVCDARYGLLVQSSGSPRRRAPRPLEISIALPVNGMVRGFTAHCEACYREPLGDDRMLLGLQFRHLDRPARGVLEDFLALRSALV